MGRPIRSDTVHTGRNAEYVAYSDDRYVRCSRCGWINNLERESKSSEGSKIGWGLTYVDQQISTAYSDSLTNYNGNDTSTVGYNVQIPYNDSLMNYDGNDTTLRYDGVTRTISDPVQTGGCSQCGTYLYNK